MKEKRRPWWDSWSVIFLITALFLLAQRLRATNWTDDLHVFVFLALIASTTGLALGSSRFSAWLAAIFGTAYGLFFIPFLFGLTINKDINWHNRIVNVLYFRTHVAISQLAAREAATDPILFLLILAVTFWILCLLASYMLVRHGSPWFMVLSAGLAFLIINHYDPTNSTNLRYIQIFILLSLLLIGRMNFIHHSVNWKKQNIYMVHQVKFDISRAVVILAVIFLFLAWLIPVTSTEVKRYNELWTTMTKPFDKVRERVSRLLLEPLQQPTIGEKASFFGTTLNLGREASLSYTQLFNVQTNQQSTSGLRNYWKARSYDIYLDGQWQTSSSFQRETLSSQNSDLSLPDWLGRELITYNFYMLSDQQRNIFTVNSPVWVSHNVEVLLFGINANIKDPIAVFVTKPMQSGEYYQIHSLVGIPTITELRESGNEYPQWLSQYLQLPEDFSADIQQLALDLTAELDNPYDKAYAITKYLRENIEYSETFPAIPQWKDPLESFLFTYKSGFCNYYASAEVLMLRSLGIPARFAVGYAQGEFNKAEGLYTVRQKDSHAWPEVYFNDYGWVEFEPTSAQPARMLPLGTSSSTPAIPISNLPSIEEEETFNDLPETETVPAKDFSPQITADKPLTLLLAWFGPFVLSPIFALIVWWIATPLIRLRPLSTLVIDGFDRRGWNTPNWLQHLSQRREHSLFEKSYSSLAKAIKRLGYPVDPTDTPAERGLVLSKMMPEVSHQVDTLVREYELARFSTHAANLLAANQSSKHILSTIRRTSLKIRLKRRFKKHSQ